MDEVPFAEALIAMLTWRHTTQQVLADRLGVTRASVNDWCRGRAVPNPDTVFAIERALDVAPGSLSRSLGYLPTDIEDAPAEPSTLACIDTDPRLDDRARRALRILYEELAGGDEK